MGSIWFRMKSELKWREVEVLSTFITVGELRSLICDKLGLDQKADTVSLISETDTEPFLDSKQLPRGSRVRAIRSTHEHLEQVRSERAEAAKKAKEETEAAAGAAEQAVAGDSEDEFGPSVFDVEAQRRYQHRQAAAAAAAAAQREEQLKSEQEAAEPAEPGEEVKKGTATAVLRSALHACAVTRSCSTRRCALERSRCKSTWTQQAAPCLSLTSLTVRVVVQASWWP
jgi:DWNN domain